MPELPEVEATVRYLRERIAGTTVIGSQIFWQRTVATHSPKGFKAALEGVSLKDVTRRGKFIVVHGCGRQSLFLCIHLRMSGSLDVVAQSSPLSSHDRVAIELDNGKSIRFNDTRKFGRIYLCQDVATVLGKLGVEPLEESFTPALLHQLLQQRSTRIKPLLLDQTVIAGLGNIYVDEALWKSHIHPTTPAHRISLGQCGALHQAIVETLSEAISLSGTDFGDGVVEGGMYSPHVYGREDEPCNRCATAIKKITVAQRGTHLCPRCQRSSARGSRQLKTRSNAQPRETQARSSKAKLVGRSGGL
jgi:formamidopyrimidine-DNA glycosylase